MLLDLQECDHELLDDLDFLKQSMMGAAERAGATIVSENFHKFDPLGVTGIIAIAESHLCIHTWPELGYAAVDIFTCGASFEPRKAADLIIERLRCVQPTVTVLHRGPVPETAASPV